MTLLKSLEKEYPNIAFVRSEHIRWASEAKTVYFNPDKIHANWSLLHEVGHMISKHKSYNSDIELLQMEVEAWKKAQEISTKYNITIDKNHIEDCLNSYRDWLYKRSLCPKCFHTGIEKKTGDYSCINCNNTWQVTKERFCRVYRKKNTPV